MDFKAKPKDKGASEECLVLHSLKMLTGALDRRKKKKGFNSQSFPNDTTKFKHTQKKKTGKFLGYIVQKIMK